MTPEDNLTLEEMAAQDGGLKPEEAKASEDGRVIDDEALPDEPPVPVDEQKVAPDEPMPEKGPANISRDGISGVFSAQTVAKVGTGTTTRKTIQKSYWFCQEGVGDDSEPVVFVQPLNNKNIPSGPKEEVPLPDFLERFSPEIEFYQQEVFPKMKEMNSTLKRAEEQRDQGALYSAQFEFQAALSFDEDNVRANFGLGLTYMERGEPEKAGDVFERIVGLEAAFSSEHKHLFNEFGINLRKSKLNDQAVEYYTKALELTTDDENLYYNIARAYYERGDKEDCVENLNKALELRPEFEEAKKFLEYLEKEEG